MYVYRLVPLRSCVFNGGHSNNLVLIIVNRRYWYAVNIKNISLTLTVLSFLINNFAYALTSNNIIITEIVCLVFYNLF